MIHLDAGQLRTAVRVLMPTKIKTSAGFTETQMTDALGYDLYCQWVNVHGSEVLQAEQLGLRQKARLRCRYHAAITPTCIVRRGTADWEIISVDNVDERGHWMEITVARKAEAV